MHFQPVPLFNRNYVVERNRQSIFILTTLYRAAEVWVIKMCMSCLRCDKSVALEAKVEEIRSTLKINPEIQDICPHCQEDSHTTLHLFDCQNNPTDLTVTDLWNKPVDVARFLNLPTIYDDNGWVGTWANRRRRRRLGIRVMKWVKVVPSWLQKSRLNFKFLDICYTCNWNILRNSIMQKSKEMKSFKKKWRKDE